MAGHELINAKGDIVSKTLIEAFRERFRRDVVRPDDAAYDTARRIWNGSVDTHPGLIARCSGVADVVGARRFRSG